MSLNATFDILGFWQDNLDNTILDSSSGSIHFYRTKQEERMIFWSFQKSPKYAHLSIKLASYPFILGRRGGWGRLVSMFTLLSRWTSDLLRLTRLCLSFSSHRRDRFFFHLVIFFDWTIMFLNPNKDSERVSIRDFNSNATALSTPKTSEWSS